MGKRNKVIIIILLIIIVLPIAYFGITSYLHDLEEKTFYEGIRNISDNENKSDIEYNKYLDKKTKTNDEIISTHTDIKESINNEILTLRELKTKLSNETYIVDYLWFCLCPVLSCLGLVCFYSVLL